MLANTERRILRVLVASTSRSLFAALLTSAASVLVLAGCSATGEAPTPCVQATTVVVDPPIDQPGQYRFEAAFGVGATMTCDAGLVSTAAGVRVDTITCAGALQLRPSHYVDLAACAAGNDAGAQGTGEGCRGIDLGRLSTQGLFDSAHVRVLLGDTVVRELTANAASDVQLGSPTCVGRELRETGVP